MIGGQIGTKVRAGGPWPTLYLTLAVGFLAASAFKGLLRIRVRRRVLKEHTQSS